MNLLDLLNLSLLISVLFLGVLLYLQQRNIKKTYSLLFSQSGAEPTEGLEKLLNQLLSSNTVQGEQISSMVNQIDSLKNVAAGSLQKIGLVRFNPFTDTGGNHSFSVCLLTSNKDGLILTAIHGREGTRLYTKIISEGRSSQTLSSEETKALESAKK